MSKFPVIQQQDSMDCGPVCLAMICKFYGKYYPVSFLHNLCFITTEGVREFNKQVQNYEMSL